MQLAEIMLHARSGATQNWVHEIVHVMTPGYELVARSSSDYFIHDTTTEMYLFVSRDADMCYSLTW